jgi:hypothetical protein
MGRLTLRLALLSLLAIGIGCEESPFHENARMQVRDGPDDTVGHEVEVYHDFDGAYYYDNGVKVYVKDSPGGDAPDRPHDYDTARN